MSLKTQGQQGVAISCSSLILLCDFAAWRETLGIGSRTRSRKERQAVMGDNWPNTDFSLLGTFEGF